MREGLTLIELIFTMVIVGLVFMTVPKIVAVSNRAMMVQIKEDALFEAAAAMGVIARSAWDQETINNHGMILKSAKIDCRNGKPYNDTNDPLIGQRRCVQIDPGNSDDACDDLDDFDQSSCLEQATSGGRVDYNLGVYITLDSDHRYKKVHLSIGTHSGKTGDFNTSFFYYSYNIGWATVENKWVE